MAVYTTIDDPSAYFQCTLYAGNNGTQTITHGGNSDLQADLIWGKARNDTAAHFRIDSVRGVSKRFKQNADAESTVSTGITAIGSDSFAVGNDGDFNDTGINYVSWNWKAGTSVSGNTTGSGTAKAYTGSVSTTAGFSIIKYLGNGTAGHTIPHHLGAAPKMIIVKSTEGSRSWIVLPPVTDGHDKDLKLNDTDAIGGSDVWNNVAPSSTVFSVGSNAVMNNNDVALIAYSFAEKQGYSKFGSYVGNGNADGTFVYTGFKPAWVMTKSSATTSNWEIKDNKRLGYNTVDTYIKANAGAAEDTGVSSHAMDFLSNGFKHKGNNDEVNGSGEAYIYMAFAENPFVTSSGVPALAR